MAQAHASGVFSMARESSVFTVHSLISYLSAMFSLCARCTNIDHARAMPTHTRSSARECPRLAATNGAYMKTRACARANAAPPWFQIHHRETPRAHPRARQRHIYQRPGRRVPHSRALIAQRAHDALRRRVYVQIAVARRPFSLDALHASVNIPNASATAARTPSDLSLSILANAL